MGFFKNVGRALKRAAGRRIERVGDWLGSETISEMGRRLQEDCSKRIGAESPYDRRNANIHTTERLNDILVAFSSGYFEQAKTIETGCIYYVQEFYDRLVQAMEEVPGAPYNKANLNAIKKGKKKIKESISGGITEPLAKRMSLDDSECLKILKMDSGTEKKEAMSKFSKRVIQGALDNLSKKIKDSITDQLNDIEEYLKDISEGQEKEFSALKEKFEKICADSNAEVGDGELHCVEPLIVVEAIEAINSICEE